MDLVETIIEDPRWRRFGLEALAERAARAALAGVGLSPDGFEIALLACDDPRIAVLNADFRGKPQPTNVLSWPAQDLAPGTPGGEPDPPAPGTVDDPHSLGDIALAWDTCEREARDQGKPLADHVTHLIIHGTLHLLGHDHVDDRDAARMEALEVRILASLGLSDPY
jgi:probable rRNA maturation factor